jgi:hypothetical protein
MGFRNARVDHLSVSHIRVHRISELNGRWHAVASGRCAEDTLGSCNVFRNL